MDPMNVRTPSCKEEQVNIMLIYPISNGHCYNATHLIVEVVESKLVDWNTGLRSSLFEGLGGLCRSKALSTKSGRIAVVCA